MSSNTAKAAIVFYSMHCNTCTLQIVFTFIYYNSFPTSPPRVTKESVAVEKCVRQPWGLRHRTSVIWSLTWKSVYAPFVHEAPGVWIQERSKGRALVKIFSMVPGSSVSSLLSCTIFGWSSSLGVPVWHPSFSLRGGQLWHFGSAAINGNAPWGGEFPKDLSLPLRQSLFLRLSHCLHQSQSLN